MDRNLYDQIISEYRKTGSVDLTARACGTYPIKVRKVLITEGLWHSKKSDAVNALRNRGYSVPEIADELQMDEKNVQYYLPYTDSALSGEKKDGARRTEAFREKSRKAAEGSMEKKKTGKRSTEKNTGSFGNPEIDNGPNIPETVAGRRGWSGYLLHLELVENMYSEEDEDCCGIFEGVKDADVLRGLIKAKEGISRDVVVSGNMTLHQLGYAIQEAFGFHNEHLHHYALPKKLMRKLTEEDENFWNVLFGSYLHMPVEEDFSDLYWDDDYRVGKSVKNWTRSKYCGEKENYAVGETFIDSRRMLDEGEGDIEDTFDRWRRNRLLGRLKIREVFLSEPLRDSAINSWKSLLRGNVAESVAYLDVLKRTRSFRSLAESMASLRFLREERDALDRAIWENKFGARNELGRNPERYLDELEMAIRELEYRIGDVMHALDPEVEPVTDTIFYSYDYGDDWLFRITCRGIYNGMDEVVTPAEETERLFVEVDIGDGARNSEIEGKLRKCGFGKNYEDPLAYDYEPRLPVSGPIRSALIRAELNKEPVCVAADGISLVEDVGGISGFFDFIRTIHGEDANEVAEMRAWARGLGWTGATVKPEKLL